MANKLKFVKFKDILSIFLMIVAFLPAMIAKIFIRDFWLVCEDKNEARDNGYWFFKYVCENHKQQKIAYAIGKKSPDYQKVKKLGKVISYGSLSHWFWYFVADKNISSQKSGKPNAAVCYLLEVVLKLRKNNRVFLQHGVIINDLEFLYYKNTNMKRVCVSTKQEESFLKEHFGYPENSIQLTGQSRFDDLLEGNTNSNQILVMPTWRQWISKEVEMKQIEGTNVFTESNYYKSWSQFLNNKKLHSILEKENKTLVFYPHRNMQKYIEHFKTNSKNIVIAKFGNYDVHELLKESALLITDYSSVFFDFAYMKKPIIFYQFDEEKFREWQHKKGYFDYKTTTLAKWSKDENEVVDMILHYIKNNMQKENPDAVDEYFSNRDDKNCERIYNMIKEINKKQS